MPDSRWLKPTLHLLLLAGLLGCVGATLAFRNYVENSPGFCRTCHEIAPEIEVWAKAQHRELRCQQCHHGTLEDGLRVLTLYVSTGDPEGERQSHAPIQLESCAGCHASHDDRWPSIANSAGHQRHLDKDEIACTDCHGQEMHFDRPARATCQSCHPGHDTGVGVHDASHCVACHDFLGEGETIRPTRASCLACHERRDRPIVVKPDAPMQFICAACHRPHATGKNAMVPCTECHRSQDLVGLHTLDAHDECGNCHEPHNWSATRKACRACHDGMESHHPEERCVHCHTFSKGAGSIR